MKNKLTLGTSFGALLITGGVLQLQQANAQITNEIRAHLDHSFVIGEKTLPPGEYTFRISQGSNLSEMTARSEDGKNAATFLVRESIDDQRPAHSELVFRKYGDTEFLSKLYQGGSKIGVSLTETSKQEKEMAKQGQPTEHTEEEK